jgi:hypothetical protein
MTRPFSCNSFGTTDWNEYERTLQQSIKDEINGLSKEYLLGVEADDFKQYVVQKYSLEVLEVLRESEHIRKLRIESQPFRSSFQH